MSNAKGILSMVNKYLCYFTVSYTLTALNSISHLLLVPVTEKLAPDTFSLTGRMAVIPVTDANSCTSTT